MIKRLKIIMLLVFGLFGSFFTFNKSVNAATLVREKIDNVWTFRKGGGLPSFSAQFRNYTIDGKTAYCIEPGTEIVTETYEGNIGFGVSPYSAEINQKIQLIGYYGYDYPGHQTQRYRMATQALIWEAVTPDGNVTEYWTEKSGSGTIIRLTEERNEIMRLVNEHYNKPEFDKSSATTTINKEVVFTDTKGVLSDYEIYNSIGANARIDGNNLYVTPNKVGNATVLVSKKTYTKDPTVLFVGDNPESQKLAYFGINDPIQVKVTVNAVGGDVTVEKLDKDTMSYKTSGNASLNGTIYGVYNESNTRVGQVTIGNNNIGTSATLSELGRFYLLEEKAGLGYKLDTTKHYFEITEDNLHPKVQVYDEVMKMEFEFYKVLNDKATGILKAEPNVYFEIYLKANNELIATKKTNEKGYFNITLAYGTYIIKQVTTTNGYEKAPDFEVVVDKDSKDVVTHTIANGIKTSKLKVVKIDEESKEVIVRDGIKFKIKNLDTNDYVCQKITYPTTQTICVYETTDGGFVTPNVLPMGNYQIEELEEQIIDGYVWNSTPLKFSINDNTNFINDEEYGVMVEVMFSNKQVKGEVEIEKLGEITKYENNTIKYDYEKIDGVSFDLIADGDIYSQDGTLIYKDKDIVSSFTTKDGYYKISDLYLGKYCLLETNTQDKYILDSTPYCFELKYVDQYTEIVKLQITLKNYLKKGNFELSKYDISTGEVVEGATITIATLDDEIIYVGKTDKDGKIILESIPVQKYKFWETDAPEGYILNDEIHYFEIKENNEIVKDKLSNKKISGGILITKTDIATGEVISGALIEIYTIDGKLVFSGITNEDGELFTDNIPYGKYYFLEKEAPEGYILNDLPHYFEIKEDGVIIKDTLTNEKEIIDVPQTESNIDIYIVGGALILNIIGGGMCFYAIIKRRKIEKIYKDERKRS